MDFAAADAAVHAAGSHPETAEQRRFAEALPAAFAAVRTAQESPGDEVVAQLATGAPQKAAAAAGDAALSVRLALPCDDAAEWAAVEEVLRGPVRQLADLDGVLTRFSAAGAEPKRCTFFAEVPGSVEAGGLDFDAFFETGWPLMREVAAHSTHPGPCWVERLTDECEANECCCC
jgi:hypothetical protein